MLESQPLDLKNPLGNMNLEKVDTNDIAAISSDESDDDSTGSQVDPNATKGQGFSHQD